MGRRDRKKEYCFTCQARVRSLARHQARNHSFGLGLRPSTPRESTQPTSSPRKRRALSPRPTTASAEQAPDVHAAASSGCPTATDEPQQTTPSTLPAHWVDEMRILLPEEPLVVNDVPVVAATSSRQHRSTQADGCPWTFGRARRQILTSIPRLVVVEPPPGGRKSVFTETERAYAVPIDDTVQRRLCDCQVCVRHTLRVVQRLQPVEPAKTPGVRFVTLPGLQPTPSDEESRRRLIRLRNDNPEQSLVACGCDICVAHRNLAHAWLTARRLAAVPPTGWRMSRCD